MDDEHKKEVLGEGISTLLRHDDVFSIFNNILNDTDNQLTLHIDSHSYG